MKCYSHNCIYGERDKSLIFSRAAQLLAKSFFFKMSECDMQACKTYSFSSTACWIIQEMPILCTAQLLKLDDGQVPLPAMSGTVDVIRLSVGKVARILLYQPNLFDSQAQENTLRTSNMPWISR